MEKRIADRVKNMKPSMTLAITAKANQLIKEGKDVVSFGAGEPDFDTPEYIQNAGIDAIQKGFTRYTPVTGMPSLKEAICQKLFKDNSLQYSNEEIIVNSGAKNSISTALQAICNPGDEVIIAVPYWVSYPEMIKLAEGVPILISTKAENDFKLTAEQITSVINRRTKAIIINTPSNPAGAVYSKEELQKIAEIAIENQIYIISDEIYEKLIYDNKEHISIASLNSEIKNLTILVNGMSKAYAMTGWRMGYTASNKEITEAMGRIQGHALSHPSSISQYASSIALSQDNGMVKEMVKAFNNRRLFMIKRLEEISDISFIYPEGAFYVFVNISKFIGKMINNDTINSSLDFSNKLLEEENVATVPGIAFGEDRYIRLSYVISKEKIKTGLDRLESFLLKLHDN